MKGAIKKILIFICVVVFSLCFTACDLIDAVKSVESDNSSKEEVSDVTSGGFGGAITSSDINITINSVSVPTSGVGSSATAELESMRQSVVEVYSTFNNGMGAGAGVVISYVEEDGIQICYVVTCHHVIENSKSVKIVTIDGDEYPAYLVGSSPSEDVCVMYAEVDKEMTVATFGNSDEIFVGDYVYAIGNPTGTLGGTVTRGIISALSREITVEDNEMTLLQTDAAINSGNSGGGLFTQDGRLIGLVNAGVSGSVEGLNFAIPSNNVQDLVVKLTETYHDDVYNSYGYIEGVFNIDCTVGDVYESRFSNKTCVIITEIDTESCLYEGGLRVGDVIQTLTLNDGKETGVVTASQLVDLVDSYELKLGDELKFYIIRNGVYKTVEILITQYIYMP